MSLDNALRERLTSLIGSHEIVLFMKGNKAQPQCGFSASVVNVLNDLGVDFESVDVLADPTVREGIKAFSNWPTIPQLYVRGEFQGGADIVREMYAKGELHKVLGVKAPEPVVPVIDISKSALASLLEARADAEAPTLRIEIDAGFRHQLYFDSRRESDVEVKVGELVVLVDPMSTRRANGLKLDFVEGPQGSGFKIDNPNAPPRVLELSARDLKAKLDAKEKLELVDVRTVEERALAKIEPSRLLDDEVDRYLGGLPKDTPLVFFCHRGGRSAAAAQHYLRKGFTKVYNLVGGVDAWAQDVDGNVARY